MFPDANDSPTIGRQRCGISLVAFSGALDLRSPKRVARRIDVVALAAPVPETAVDKDKNPSTREDHVWLASDEHSTQYHVAFRSEVSKSPAPERRGEAPLGPGPSTVCPHGIAPLLRLHDVGHRLGCGENLGFLARPGEGRR